MEEISFTNFFRFISSVKAQIPIIETSVVQGDYIDLLLTTDEQGYIKKRPLAKIFPIRSYLQKLLEENDWKNRIHSERNKKICYFYKKSHKALIVENKLKELIMKPRLNLNIDMIQKYIEPISSLDKPLVLKLVYLNNQYHADIFYGNSRVNDPITLSLVFDVAIIAIHTFEANLLKRVVRIEIEYIKESPSKIYLSNVLKCIIIEAKYTLGFPLTKIEDLDVLIKSIPRQYSKSLKSLKDTPRSKEALYVFRRGQLRNEHSNLESPIRVVVGNNLIEEVNNEEKVVEGTKDLTNESIDEFDDKPPDKLLINELLKGFFINKSNSLAVLPEGRGNVISPSESKWQRKQANSLVNKIMPKTQRGKKTYGNDFIELVMNTYVNKKRDKFGEFGLSGSVSNEEFCTFLSTVDKDLQSKGNEKVILEESAGSRSSSIGEGFPRKKFEMQFVSNILAKRKDMFTLSKRIPVIDYHNQKMMKLIMKSPRCRSKGNVNDN